MRLYPLVLLLLLVVSVTCQRRIFRGRFRERVNNSNPSRTCNCQRGYVCESRRMVRRCVPASNSGSGSSSGSSSGRRPIFNGRPRPGSNSVANKVPTVVKKAVRLSVNGVLNDTRSPCSAVISPMCRKRSRPSSTQTRTQKRRMYKFNHRTADCVEVHVNPDCLRYGTGVLYNVFTSVTQCRDQCVESI